MQHSNVLRGQNMHQHARLHVPYLYKARLESEDIRVEDGEGLRVAFPIDHPVAACSPAVTVDEEAVVGVAEQELCSDALDVDGLDALLALDKVE